ncbi:MAG: helix-turn-helix transcriptional regulator [Muribaculaceae bacterium]|nr:helix-turn-helix transcriptional regulator [Muribaculaceae bacterium]
MCKILNRIKEYLDYKGIPIATFERSVGMSNSSFGKQLKKGAAIGTDKLENILINYPDLSPVWLLTGQGYMIISPDDPVSATLQISTSVDTRPRIPFDAAAGSLSLAIQGVSSTDCEQIPVIPTLPQYDFSIIARGDSMYPEFMSGDELACAFVHETSFIQWGRAHILDTAQGVVLKKIFDRKTSILCRSINSDYPDFEIPKNDIYHLAIVVGLIRHF